MLPATHNSQLLAAQVRWEAPPTASSPARRHRRDSAGTGSSCLSPITRSAVNANHNFPERETATARGGDYEHQKRCNNTHDPVTHRELELCRRSALLNKECSRRLGTYS